MFRTLLYGLPVFLLVMVHGPTVHADLILGFSTDNGTTFTNSVSAGIGDPITIGIYARQTGSETRLTEFGLVGAGVLGRFDLTELSLENFGLAPGFSNLPNNSDPPGEVILSGVGLQGSSRLVAVKGESVLIGEVTFRLLGDSPSVLSFGDIDRDFGIDGNFTDFVLDQSPAFPDLDPIFFGGDLSRTFDVTFSPTAVPEPSSFVLAAIAGAAILFRKKKEGGRQLTAT